MKERDAGEAVKATSRVASLNQCEGVKLDYLWINRTGAALGFVERLPELLKTSYEKLCTSLDQLFGAERLADAHKAQMLSKKRMDGETFLP